MGEEYDVIIVGGGITGAGTARDCAMRGLKTLLVERRDIASGATGGNHGLLHSGARYAVTDSESAMECIAENRILRRIARHCIEPCDGLFITLPEDELSYQDKFIASCRAAHISARAIDPAQARIMEPSVNPSLIGAVVVPDGSIDPFRLAEANVADALIHGADILKDNELISFIKQGDSVVGVRLYDRINRSEHDVYARCTVNAGGIWGQNIASMAGIGVRMFPAKGTLLVFGHRISNMVVNRCRKPSDGDILVPGDSVSVLGTTSTRIPYDEIDNVRPLAGEVDTLLREGSKIVPSLSSSRVIRAYSGVRPLVASDDDPSGRNISRGIVLLDHRKRDSIDGLITITGGKLMTYRLMAEKATNLVCERLGVDAGCRTAVSPLPGSESSVRVKRRHSMGHKAASFRRGTSVSMLDSGLEDELVCECENVSMAEIRYAVENLGVRNLEDLRRRTRLGMGTCQGAFCMSKAAKAMASALGNSKMENELLAGYLRERWKGMRSVSWGDTLREAEFMRKRYAGKCDAECVGECDAECVGE